MLWCLRRQYAFLLCRNLDYYGRLDTDSRIVAPVTDDIFDYMHDNGLKYGWVLEMTEQPSASP